MNTADPLALIRSRRAEIKDQRQKLDAEDAELDQAERTIVRLSHRPTGNGHVMPWEAPKTQKEYVIATLKTSENAWFENVRALRDAVAAKGKDLPITTFQPLISDMVKNDGLVRDGSKIALKERVNP
jgi:hypothetical protein